MSKQSEDRLPDSEPAREHGAPSARILPFERPQSDLQRAIQLRAQEAIERDRDREREKKKPRPLRWVVIFVLALIPVVIIFGMIDGFLRALHKFNETWQSEPAEQSAPAPEQPPQTQPGVVLLQPYGTPPPAENPAPPAEDQAPPAKE